MIRGFFSKITYIFLVFSFFMPNFALSAQLPTDPFMYEQWYLDQINATRAWDITTGSKDVIVALLDSGFDLDHEDLSGQFWKNIDEIDGNNKDNDYNGYEDDVYGWDFVDGDNNPLPNTENVLNDTVISHGTILAGIIGAATNNNIGIAGINHNVSIMPLRVLDENGSGSSANVRRAIEYAVNNGAEVINFSFSFNKPDDRLQSVIQWAYDQGVVMVSAVGNGDLNTDQNPVYPACFDTRIGKNVIIGVASTDKKDKKAHFSNYGKICTDISAPGVNIFGTVYNDNDVLLLSTSYGGPWEGTSISAPIVSAAAALLKSHYPSLTPDQVRNVLKLSVDPIKELSVDAMGVLGVGRLNIENALVMASGYTRSSGFILNKPKVNTSKSFVVSQASGSDPLVQRVDGKGNILTEFLAYNKNFKGGVRVAMGDLDGDDEMEIITAAGPGGGPQVRIFDLNGNVLDQFFAYDEENRFGIYVEVGDVDADGIDDIIVTQDIGGTGQVKIFNRTGKLKGSFLPFGRTSNLINVAVSNTDTDPEEEIIVSAITSDGARVKIFDGNGRYVSEISVNKNIKNQILVSAGDLDSDGISEIIVSSGQGNDSMVYIHGSSGEMRKSFYAYGHGFVGGVQTSVGDIDNNGVSEIYTSPISRGSTHVRIFTEEEGPIGGFILESSENNGAFISI